ncbi:uncharacterized protein C8orf58 homolog isoform X5 [Pogoniulus pusillus]|uniref:uncharacterized protein C8orf58 homolog isoform X5 n=1 Tax=Pogoniulus pusillus TaxID=488313 RepID=UPI0030B96FA8
MWGSSCGVWKRRFSGYGPWEAAESCVVGTSASTYRRLQESPEQPRGAALSSWGPPPRAALSSSRPPASEHLPRCESEDSGVEMPSNEPSPLTPLGTHGSFSLPRKPPPVGGPGTDPPRPQHSRSASKKLAQAAQRSRRQRAPGRCPRQLGRHSGGAASLWAQLARESREQEEPKVENPDGEPTQPPGWRGQRFRPRSCSDSQTPAPDPEPCRRRWGHSASSPNLLDPCEGSVGPPPADTDGRWGRVKLLLTRLAHRSLRGGRCR